MIKACNLIVFFPVMISFINDSCFLNHEYLITKLDIPLCSVVSIFLASCLKIAELTAERAILQQFGESPVATPETALHKEFPKRTFVVHT